MGGFGSGRQYGRPTADESRRIDFAWMLRRGMAVEGRVQSGVLNWSRGDRPAGSIGYRADMSEGGYERLILIYTPRSTTAWKLFLPFPKEVETFHVKGCFGIAWHLA